MVEKTRLGVVIKMKIVGYTSSDEESFVQLEEATITCTINELDKIIEFLNYVKITNSDNELAVTTHSHYRDWDEKWTNISSDLIIITKNK